MTVRKIVKNEVQVVCVAEFHAIAGRTEALIEALHRLMPPTHQEAGCLRYELNQRVDDARWVTFIEKWTSQKTFDEHCATPYITHYFNQERPGLVESCVL
jgi:quinol monooxygenase YgiN